MIDCIWHNVYKAISLSFFSENLLFLLSLLKEF
jgi:hypothetical protein